MISIDLALARRLERQLAWSSAAHAEVQARRYPETGATVLPAGGGWAAYCGRVSPLNQVCGAGLAGPVSAAALDAIEAFYRERGHAVRIRICPLVDPSLLRLLGERCYAIQDFMSVHVRPIEPVDAALPDAPGIEIRTATLAEAKAWFERSGAGGSWAEPDGIAFMLIRCLQKPDTELYLAFRDGEPAGGGALEIHEGVAALVADSTLAPFRRQGIQTALLRARLAAAAAGCDLALVQTRPATGSERNARRAGFQLAYTASELARPPRS